MDQGDDLPALLRQRTTKGVAGIGDHQHLARRHRIAGDLGQDLGIQAGVDAQRIGLGEPALCDQRTVQFGGAGLRGITLALQTRQQALHLPQQLRIGRVEVDQLGGRKCILHALRGYGSTSLGEHRCQRIGLIGRLQALHALGQWHCPRVFVDGHQAVGQRGRGGGHAGAGQQQQPPPIQRRSTVDVMQPPSQWTQAA